MRQPHENLAGVMVECLVLFLTLMTGGQAEREKGEPVCNSGFTFTVSTQ